MKYLVCILFLSLAACAGPTGGIGIPGAPGVSATPVPTPVPAPQVSGLSCNLYDLSLIKPSVLPSFAPPAVTQVLVPGQVSAGPIVSTFLMTGAINFATTTAMLAGSGQVFTTYYALDCTGTFEASENQVYNLSLDSDDGSALLIDGLTVIGDDGTHGATTKTGSIAVTAGQHSIELQYFQVTGPVLLELSANVPMVFSN